MEYLIFFDMVGIVAFALSGYILASKAGLDILGISLVSFVTAFGGGIIRDLMVNKTPFVFSETYPILVALLTVVFAYFLKLHRRTKLSENKFFLISDTIGLVIFAITGASIALAADFNFGGVVGLALLTAIGGGVIRDIILNEVPYVFLSEFYGTVAVIVGILMWVIDTYLYIDLVTTGVVLMTGLVFRGFAIKFHWKLPKLVD